MSIHRLLRTGSLAVAAIFAAGPAHVAYCGQPSSVDLDPGNQPQGGIASRLPAPPSPAASAAPTPRLELDPSQGLQPPESSTRVASRKRSLVSEAKAHEAAPKVDELDPKRAILVKDAPPTEVNLPGVLKLNGAALGLLDPARARRISCTNEGTTTVYFSASEPNRIQLPFVNPRVIGTPDLEIDKRPDRSNVYVTFAAGITHPATVWFEPHSGSSLSCGLQVIPMRIPAQSLQIVDDSGAASQRTARADASNDFLSRVQADLEDALEGQAPAGWSSVNVPVPPIAIDGVLIEGVRRLSSVREDIYVYTVFNPGSSDVVLEETEFDGPAVEAVSILPTPLLHSRGTTRVAVLVKKTAARPQDGAATSAAEGR